MSEGLHAVFAGLCTAALVAFVFAATADHWMTTHIEYRLEAEE